MARNDVMELMASEENAFKREGGREQSSNGSSFFGDYSLFC
jgi:hypothetical protein